ncbi:type I restriction endonuclease subunit M [Nitrospirales bacterium NOB]|nr:type I restriction endonuclease subunit M [Nitrospirales bacterium NOB]
MEQIKQPLFPLGQVVATPGVLDKTHPVWMANCLARHMRGDWGSVDEEDIATNNEAVRLGFRVLSAYPIDETQPCKGFGDNTLWIITEADHSVTTFLLPNEY